MIDDTCDIIGIKNGVETLLGRGPIPWNMKAKEILFSYGFNDFSDEDSQASYALAAVEELVAWMVKMGWTPPPMTITSVSSPDGAQAIP